MRPCTQCGAPLPGEARFCNHCGGTQAATAPAGVMRVCGSCGVIAPTGRAQCMICNASIAAAPTVPRRQDEHYWMCVLECDFACRGCGMRSPLNGLDVDGVVQCARCGLEQAFEVDQWEEVLGFAQDVADCAGPPGRFGQPPVEGSAYTAIGVSHTYAEKTLTGMVIDGEGMKPRTLRLRAAPGVPLCERCHVPLEVTLDTESDEHRATTVCAHCRERAVYQVPDGAFDANCDIAAILADDHRCDREAVHVRAAPGGGAVAITCPKCDAALPVHATTSFVQCSYCGTPSRIPSRVLGRMGAPIAAKRWWVLFDDVSSMRSGASSSDDDDDDDDEDFRELERGDKLDRVREAQAAEASARAAAAAREQTHGPQRLGMIFGFVGVLLAGAVVASILMRGRAPAAASEPEETKPTSTPTTAKASKAAAEEEPATIDRKTFRDLTGCSCTVGKDKRQLAIRVDVQEMGMVVGEDDGMVAKFDLSWILDSKDGPFLLKDGGAPPARVKGRALSVTVACDADVFAVVAKDRATGWSVDKQKKLWDVNLDTEVATTAKPSEKGLGVSCALAAMNKGQFTVPLANGKRVTLAVATGRPAK